MKSALLRSTLSHSTVRSCSLAWQVNQRAQVELNRVKAPEPEPAPPQVDPLQYVDADLAAKMPRERRRKEGFTFLQAGKLQRDAEVMRLRVSAAALQAQGRCLRVGEAAKRAKYQAGKRSVVAVGNGTAQPIRQDSTAVRCSCVASYMFHGS